MTRQALEGEDSRLQGETTTGWAPQAKLPRPWAPFAKAPRGKAPRKVAKSLGHHLSALLLALSIAPI
ncbi:unnamed protein product [Ilex paraguariensis]|uniref:Uncharacterized protein n=1 Tax=Ilex paraguariensis TaxID=185542 RepID=A0ABC8SDX5_9AQUA